MLLHRGWVTALGEDVDEIYAGRGGEGDMVGGGGEQERKVSAKDGRGREERGERRGEKSKEQSEWRGVKGGEKEKRRKECKWYECGRGGFVYSQTRVRRKQSRALPTRFEIGFGAGSNMRQQHSTEVERRNEKQQTTQCKNARG